MLYWFGRLLKLRGAAWLAAALLALNGYHIAWSGFARMYVPASTIGVFSAVLLLLLSRGSRSKLLLVVYPLALVAGAAFHAYFWTLIAAHMLWVLTDSWSSHRPLPVAWNLQVTAVLLASPLVAFGTYQSHHLLVTLSSDTLRFAKEWIQFSFLIPQPGLFDLHPDRTADLWLFRVGGRSVVMTGLLILSLVLFVAGLHRLSGRNPQTQWQQDSLSWRRIWLTAAVIAATLILVFVWRVQNPHEGIRTTRNLSALPLLIFGLCMLLRAFWNRLPERGRAGVARYLGGTRAFAVFLVIVPFAVLAALAAVRTVFVPRGLVLLTPYLLLVVAAGTLTIARRWWIAAPLIAVLAILHLQSVAAHSRLRIDPVDFRAFAEMLRPRIQPDDLIFLRRHWASTPILYYLRPDRYSVYANDFGSATTAHPGSRVWQLVFYGDATRPDSETALRSYHRADVVELGPATASLYVR